MGGGIIDFRGVEHGLGRHAAAVEAGAADLVLFDQGHLGAQLCGTDRRYIAAGTAADDQDAVVRRRGRCCSGRGRRSCCRRGRCGSRIRNRLSGCAEPADQRLAGHRLTGRNQDLEQNAVRLCFHVVRQFVRFHREEDLALLNGVTDVFLPRVYRSLGHREAEFRH